jgi:hypothetical protein
MDPKYWDRIRDEYYDAGELHPDFYDLDRDVEQDDGPPEG